MYKRIRQTRLVYLLVTVELATCFDSAGSSLGLYMNQVMLNFNPLNAELNPICHLLALLGAHHILHVSRIRVKNRAFYIYRTGVPLPSKCCIARTQHDCNQDTKGKLEAATAVIELLMMGGKTPETC